MKENKLDYKKMFKDYLLEDDINKSKGQALMVLLPYEFLQMYIRDIDYEDWKNIHSETPRDAVINFMPDTLTAIKEFENKEIGLEEVENMFRVLSNWFDFMDKPDLAIDLRSRDFTFRSKISMITKELDIIM